MTSGPISHPAGPPDCRSPDHLIAGQKERTAQIAAACPEMTVPQQLISAFAVLLKPTSSNAEAPNAWIAHATAHGLPHVQSFARGLQQDLAAVNSAVTLPHHNGRTEGVNTRTKMIKRQMYGRAGFNLLHHRILLD